MTFLVVKICHFFGIIIVMRRDMFISIRAKLETYSFICF